MRRPLHCLLVGFLVCSLSVDTARACWRQRHARRGHAAVACPVAPACGGWSDAVVVADVAVGCGWTAYPAAVVPAGCWAEEIACGQPLDCCGGELGMASEDHVVGGTIVATDEPTISGELLTARPVAPEIAPAVEPVGRPAPLEPRPAEQPSIVSVGPARPATPEEQPVEPASATQPADEVGVGPDAQPDLTLPTTPEPDGPVPQPEADRRPATPEPAKEPPAPVERNLFEEDDAAQAQPAAPEDAPRPAPQEPPQDPPAAEERSPAGTSDPAPAAEPNAADDAPPAPAEPDATESVEPEPAAEPFSQSERNRRWIDATGRYAVVGALVAVLDGRAEIRKPDGGSISVPLDRLSPYDRAYAEATGQALVGSATARPIDTAGL